MTKQIIARTISAVLVITSTLIPQIAQAAEVQAVENTAAEPEVDPRVLILEKYLEEKNSPLAGEADTFIEVADKYNLDWKFLPAIAGMESNFGQRVLENSYNPFGWGGGYTYFESWEDGIETVGAELYQRVVIKYGTPTAESLGPSYCPPNYRNWIAGVNFFMDELSSYN